MSTISLIIIIAGLAATLLFLAGFIRGLRNAIADRDREFSAPVPAERGHVSTAIVAVIGSAAIITAIGFSAAAIYIGPLLCLVTAAAVGLAFFIERQN